MAVPLADYRAQRDAFAALFEPACAAGILLFSGGSGSGKTSLVSACLDAVPARVTAVPIDLKNKATTLPEIFQRVGGRLGWDNMPAFADQVAGMQQSPGVKIDRNWLAGIANHITVAMRVENTADRDERRAILTEAWFDDLRRHPRPLLIAFDTYENAVPDVQDWIAGPFLSRAIHTGNLRVLIAGQAVPDPANIDYRHCCVHHRLYGVPEAEHWLPVIEAMGRCIPFEPPLVWFAGVCHALKGAPKDIMQVIEGLPFKEGRA